jgi:hypothetical protein
LRAEQAGANDIANQGAAWHNSKNLTRIPSASKVRSHESTSKHPTHSGNTLKNDYFGFRFWIPIREDYYL